MIKVIWVTQGSTVIDGIRYDRAVGDEDVFRGAKARMLARKGKVTMVPAGWTPPELEDCSTVEPAAPEPVEGEEEWLS